MDGIGAILTFVFVAGMVGLSFVAFRFLTGFIPFMNDAFNFITWPIHKVGRIAKQMSQDRGPKLIPAPLDQKLSVFGGATTFFLFAASAIFVIIVFIVEACITKTAGQTLERIIFNTTMGAFLALFDEGFSFSPATLVAVGFSGFLASACMNRAEDLDWYIWIPYCVIFVSMSAIVASFLEGVFEVVGNWGLESIELLQNAQDTSTFSLIWRTVALVFLGYFALVLIVMTAREYYACICFGPLSMAGFVLAAVLIEYLWADPNYAGPGYHWTEYAMLLTMFAAILLVEYFRQVYDQKTLFRKPTCKQPFTFSKKP